MHTAERHTVRQEHTLTQKWHNVSCGRWMGRNDACCYTVTLPPTIVPTTNVDYVLAVHTFPSHSLFQMETFFGGTQSERERHETTPAANRTLTNKLKICPDQAPSSVSTQNKYDAALCRVRLSEEATPWNAYISIAFLFPISILFVLLTWHGLTELSNWLHFLAFD